MSLPAFCRLLRSRWHGLASAFWPPTVSERIQREIALLDDRLARCSRQLLKKRQKIEKNRYYLEQINHRPDVHLGMKRGRLLSRLEKRERMYREAVARFDRLKQERRKLSHSLHDSPSARQFHIEEESDSGYPF